jgi:hypothetical protein
MAGEELIPRDNNNADQLNNNDIPPLILALNDDPVPTAVQRITPVNPDINTWTEDPNANGTNGKPKWRRSYGEELPPALDPNTPAPGVAVPSWPPADTAPIQPKPNPAEAQRPQTTPQILPDAVGLQQGQPTADIKMDQERIRKILDNSLEPNYGQASTLGHIALGGAGGLLGGGPLPQLYDRTVACVAWAGKRFGIKQAPGGLLGAVHNEFSPHAIASVEEMSKIAELETVKEGAEKQLTDAKGKLPQALADRDALTKEFGPRTKIGQYLRQHGTDIAMLEQVTAAEGQAPNKAIGQLLTRQQCNTLTEPIRLQKNVDVIPEVINKLDGEIKVLNDNMAEAGKVKAFSRPSSSYWKDFTKGGAGAGSILALNYGLDKYFYDKNHIDRTWFLDGVGVPAGLLWSAYSKKPGRGLFLAGSSIVGSYLLDKNTPLDNDAYSTLMRPNNVDAVGAGVSFALSTKTGWKGNLAMFAGTWLVGRGYNIVSDALREDPSEAYKEATDNFKAYIDKPSTDAFQTAVQKGKNIGMSSEAVLELDLKDWRDSHNYQGQANASEWVPYIEAMNCNAVSVLSGTAVRTASIAEARLASGSRLVTPNIRPGEQVNHDHTDRILPGTDYDFGGEAAIFFDLTRELGKAAADYAASHKDQNIHGHKITAADIAQQNEISQYATDRIDDICNGVDGQGHDMDAIFTELKHVYRMKIAESGNPIGDFEQRMAKLVDNPASSDPKIQAKTARDIGLLMLAIADYKAEQGDGIGAAQMYTAAAVCYSKTVAIDPNAPDNSKIHKIAKRIADERKLDTAIWRQFESNAANPNNIPNPLSDKTKR